MAPSATRRINAKTPTGVLLLKKVIERRLDPPVVEQTFAGKRIPFRFVSHQHSGCTFHSKRGAFGQIALNGLLHAWAFDQRRDPRAKPAFKVRKKEASPPQFLARCAGKD